MSSFIHPRSANAVSRCQDSRRPIDEEALLERLLADDPTAWRELVTRYSRLILRCISRTTLRFRRLVNDEDLRDIYCGFCLELLAADKKKLRRFDPARGQQLGSWLAMLATHSTYDYLRRLRREPQLGTLEEAERLPTASPDPFEQLVERQEVEAVSDAMEGFSEKDQTFIRLYYGEGLEPEVIAERLGVQVGSVYTKKHKIAARLAGLLSSHRVAA